MILTIDLGTSVTKVAVWNDDGLVAMGRAPLVTTHPAANEAEQDPHSWWRSVVDACPTVEGVIDVIGMSAARQTFVPVTADGEPLGQAILWSDHRAAAGDEWLASHEPDRLAASRWLLSPRDLMVWQMTGVVATDWTLASVSGLVDRVPEAVPSITVVGGLLPDAATALGLPAGVPVVIGAGDRQCEVLGTGASAARPMVSWGTTANVSVPIEAAPSTAPAGILLTKAAVDGWLLEGGISAAGAFIAWLGKLTGSDELLKMATESPPGARGVVAVPWLGGARAPWWRGDAGAAFVNLSAMHGVADLSRAAVESVAWEVDRCLRRAAPDAAGLALAGSGSLEPAWVEILTSVTGLPAQRRRSAEAASVGAALVAALGVGASCDVDRLSPISDAATPQPETVAAYESLRPLAQRTADALIGLADL